MGNYSTIQTRVTRRVIDLPSAVTAEVPQLVSLAISKLQERHNFKVMESRIAAFTTVNSGLLVDSVGGSTLTASFEYPSSNVFGSFVNDEGGYSVIDSGFPQAIHPVNSGADNLTSFYVFPVPDGNSDYSDGEYRIFIPVWQYLPALTDSQSNWFTSQPSGEEFIVRYATSEAHSLNWDFEKEAIMKAEAEIHYKDLVLADKRYRLSATTEFVPHWRGVHQNRTRL